ncbi:MAG: hypothetical protein H7248_01320 [Microbacteriaceae bacterium]|nr:hypothetical protein [Microbacteriaceae bacterium]
MNVSGETSGAVITTQSHRPSLWVVMQRQLLTPQLIYGTILISAVIGWAEDDDSVRKVLTTAVSTAFVFWAAHVLCEALSYVSKHPSAQPSRAVPDEPDPVLSLALKYGLSHSGGLLYSAVIPCLLLGLGTVGILSEAESYWLALGIPVTSLALLGWMAFRDHPIPWYKKTLAAVCVSTLGIIVIILKVAVH